MQIEERKLEEAMERKEQERLEEILAMCAQYEEQNDSEIRISVAIGATTESQSQPSVASVEPTSGHLQGEGRERKGAPPQQLDLAHVYTSNYNDTSTAAPPIFQLPGMIALHCNI